MSGAPRQTIAQHLVDAARDASRHISEGIRLLASDPHARLAFSAMNEAVARANHQPSERRVTAAIPLPGRAQNGAILLVLILLNLLALHAGR